MNFSCGGKNSSLSSGAVSGNDVGTGAPWVLKGYFLLIDHRRKPKWDDGIFNGEGGSLDIQVASASASFFVLFSTIPAYPDLNFVTCNWLG